METLKFDPMTNFDLVVFLNYLIYQLLLDLYRRIRLVGQICQVFCHHLNKYFLRFLTID